MAAGGLVGREPADAAARGLGAALFCSSCFATLFPCCMAQAKAVAEARWLDWDEEDNGSGGTQVTLAR